MYHTIRIHGFSLTSLTKVNDREPPRDKGKGGVPITCMLGLKVDREDEVKDLNNIYV